MKEFNKVRIKHSDNTLLWKIDGEYISIKVEGRINLRTMLKILIQENKELKHFKYQRTCPYKIIHEFARNRKDRRHVFNIAFIDVTDNKIKTIEIIKTDSEMGIDSGEYNYFIPDLLEIAIDRKLTTLKKDVYEYIGRIFENPKKVNYIDIKLSKEYLVDKGWKVPNGYKEPLIN